MSEKLQDELDMIDIKDILVDLSVETKDDIENEIDIKDVNHLNDNLETGSPKSSRELKSLLALSKEAKLDTNIVHKRKSVEFSGKAAEKSEQLVKTSNTTETVDMQSQLRPIIRVDYTKPDVDVTEIQETKDGCAHNKTSWNNLEDLDNTITSVEDIATDTTEKSNRNVLTNVVVVINNQRKDPFCWVCHHEKATFYCETCPRSFHQRCLKHNVTEVDHWICPVCVGILKAESLKQRSPAMRDISLEQLCGLLKFALKRMMQVEGHEPFIHPVNEVDFPEYKKYVAQPQDLTCLEKNIKSNVYGSPQAFEADVQWILHNSIIFNSYQSKFTSIAKSMMKICKQEMAEIENCANCYSNANTKKKTWFVEVCPKPHMVVWAKLKGFPYWPAKAMRTNSYGLVDVRFFGAHDRAWVPSKDCFLYCIQDPNSNKQKRNDINESIKELNIYIENLKRMYGEFRYAPYRVIVDPEEELKQLRMLLPRYDPEQRIKPGRGFRKSLHRNGNCSSDLESSEKDSDESFMKIDEDLAEDMEHNQQSDGSNCGSISDESSTVGNLPGRSSNVRMRGGFVNTSGRIKVLPKTHPDKKRLSGEDLSDPPPKLSRHDSDESMNHSDNETSEKCLNANKMEDSVLTNEIDCPKLNDESNTSAELPKSSITDLLLKKLTDLIDEEPEKDKIVSETDLLLDTINNKIDSILEKYPELTLNTDKVDSVSNFLSTPLNKSKKTIGAVEVIEVNVTENPPALPTTPCTPTKTVGAVEVIEVHNRESSSVSSLTSCKPKETIVTDEVIEVNVMGSPRALPTTPRKAKETIGTVEVIEVNVTEGPELTNQMEFEMPVNIQDIVQATDISTVSISTVELDIVTVSKNTEQLLDAEAAQPTLTSSVESLDQNLNSWSSTDDYTNPLDFVEVTENIPVEEKDTSEEDILPIEKTADILDVLTQTIAHGLQTKPTAELQQSNKRRRSSDNTETGNTDEHRQQKKSLRLVNIDDIRNKVLDSSSLPTTSNSEPDMFPMTNNLDSTTEPLKSLESLLEKQLLASTKNAEITEDSDTVIIKSEPNSEDEVNAENDAEYMELKRRYLSALNISEKLPQPPKKPISMRTRSKSEENKVKLVNSLSKVMDDATTYFKGNHDDLIKKNLIPKRKEIFVKPLSKMLIPKQKARKSFPVPVRNVYSGQSHKKDISRIGKPLISATSTSSIRTPAIKSNEVYTSSNNIVYIAHSPLATNAATILPPNQPITYSANRGNPILTMMQHPGNYLPLTSASGKSATDRYESQNYIPLSGEVPRPRAASHLRLTLTTVSESNVTTTVTQITSSATTPSTVLTTTSAMTDVLDGLGTLTTLIPDTLNKTISDIMCRAPPKLKRRPPGPLSAHFDEGLPSSAGTISSRVNSISHRLGDYFRGMLIELLHEMSNSDNPEVEITKLKLENEELKYKHNEEIMEIKKNVSNILKDVQKSIEDERTRITEETRSACETESVKRVEEAKSKQWCANCPKEAQFYCCWNTSYCDFPCQEKHWSKHMSKCTQNIQNSRVPHSSSSTITTGTTTTRPTQPFVLRQTAAPKGFTTKAVIAKPTKVILNRASGAKNAISYVRTTSGSHITLVESTPGNYELVGNGGPISVGGKFITGLGKIRSNVISVSSPSAGSSTSTGVAGSTQKAVLITKSAQPTVISDDDD